PMDAMLQARSVGRPRCLRTQQTILSVAADLLETVAYRDITIERIAAEAGVGKQTIYRWYEGKADLMLDAFLMRYTVTVPLTGGENDEISDLRRFLHQFAVQLANPAFEAAYRALFAEAQLDATFRRRFSQAVLEKRRAFVVTLVSSILAKMGS